ncbi:MAG: clostripain-related cysteine peptidase [Candidatus Sumerlaeota bacterium]|nr:clostripain-related cysteine peptidase [Candidatus Sumerlaeota bacterium]
MKISTLLLASLLFSVAITASPNSSQAEWTFMVYVDGDNNLEGAGVTDINEMEKVGSNSHLNIVVIFDRAPGYDTSNGDWTDTRRGIIIADSNPDIISSSIQSVGEKNMGDPATLTDFTNWAITNYPANHYVLVLWNHGGGWRSNIDRINKEIASLKSLAASAPPEQKKSAQLRIAQLIEQKKKNEVLKEVCYDSTSGDYLYTSELRQALENIPTHIDIVGFDACLMQMVEVAYELKSEASIMVGSEETEPGNGWPYDLILGDLSANPTMTPAQLATVIVTRYGESYNGLQTQSAIDLSAMSGLATALNTFAGAIISTGTEWQSLFNARAAANYYTDSPNFRDLGGFLNAMAQLATNPSVLAAVNQSRSALQAAVIANHSHPSEGAHGLSIYLTNLSSSPSSAYSAANILFAADTQWDEMLKAATTQPIPDDSYEPNDTFNQAATISTGSYLGLCCKNDDWFKVYLPAGARVSIACVHEYDAGDLDLQFYNSSDVEIASSETLEDVENIFVSITASGYYYIQIFGYLDAVNYYYSLFVYDATHDAGYVCERVPYQFVDYSGATRLVMGDDDFTAIPLGFQFNFYGQPNSTIMISANGYMTFGVTGNMYNNLSIPLPSSGGSIPGGLIAPFWDDLVPPSSNGGVFYQITGGEGNKRLIVTWANCSHYFGSTGGVTFQAILQENDDSILFNYSDVSFSDSYYDNGISATVGIQNQTGERGCVFGFNQSVLEDNMSLQFQKITSAQNTWLLYQ